jgi:hypothetical protein
MKSIVFGLALCAAAFPALAQTNVSVSVGQPGFYGRVDIGDFAPRPVLYAPQPVLIERGPAYIAEPIYVRVPPGHRRNWARYCGRYGACGRPVLFVRDEWYRNTYVPRWREVHGHGYGYGRPPVRVVERVEYRDYPRGHHGGPGPRPRGDWNHGGPGHDGPGHDGPGHGGPGHGGGHDGGHGGGHGGGHDGGHDGGHGGGHGHGR